MRIRKRIGALTLVLCLLLGMIPAYATDEVASGTCGDNLTWVFDDSGTLTISGSGAMEDYSVGDETIAIQSWVDYENDIKTVIIESGVTSIGAGAFTGYALTSVTILVSATSIGENAFSRCDVLTDVYYGGTETQWNAIQIEEGNAPLTSATIHYNSSGATASDETAQEMILGDINGDGMVDETDISILDAWIVQDVNTLSELTGQQQLTEQQQTAADFNQDGEVNAMDLKLLTQQVRGSQQGYCGGEGDGSNLTWVLDGSGTLTISGSGAMADLNISDNEVTDMPWGEFRESIRTVVMESGVTTIGSYAFSNCEALTNVTIPDTVTAIGGRAFVGCALTGVKIPDSVTWIGVQAFLSCGALTSVTIPDSVTILGDGAFMECASLTSATISGGLTSIGGETFLRCENLKTVTIPNSVTSVGQMAFYECAALTDVYYGGAEEQWNQISIAEGNDPLISATIHYSSSGGDATTYAVTLDKTEHGVITVGPISAAEGAKISLTATPDEGYEFKKWDVKDANGAAVTVTEAGSESYFTMPAANVTVAATFAAKAVTLSSVALTPASVTLDGTNGATSTATAIDANGNAITSGVTWSVTPANQGVPIDSEGKITIAAAATAGNYTVTATYENVSKSVTLTVTRAVTLASVTLNPETVTVDGTKTETVTATAIGSDGQPLREFTWGVEPHDGSVTANDTPGSFTVSPDAVPGEYIITITYDNVSVSKTLTVTRAVTLASVTLNPSLVTLDGTNGASVTATALDQYGAAIASGVTWSVTPSGVGVEITDENSGAIGIAASATAGEYIVTATYESVSVSATLTVTRVQNVTYTVTFDANGGGGSMNAVTVQEQEYALPKCGFDAPFGMRFIAWRFQSSGGGSSGSGSSSGGTYRPGQTVYLVGDTVLTALWAREDTRYTIAFDANGGGGAMNPVKGMLSNYVNYGGGGGSSGGSAAYYLLASANVTASASDSETHGKVFMTQTAPTSSTTLLTDATSSSLTLYNGVTSQVTAYVVFVPDSGYELDANSLTVTGGTLSAPVALTLSGGENVTYLSFTGQGKNYASTGGDPDVTITGAFKASGGSATLGGATDDGKATISGATDNGAARLMGADYNCNLVQESEAGFRLLYSDETAPAPDSVAELLTRFLNSSGSASATQTSDGYSVTLDSDAYTVTAQKVDDVTAYIYALPENGFTAPSGKAFKAWSVNGTEYAPGATISVSGDTTVTAVWEEDSSVIHIIFIAANSASSLISGTGVDDYYELAAVDNDEIKTLRIKSGASLSFMNVAYTPGAGNDNAENCVILNSAVYNANDLMVSGSWISASGLSASAGKGITLVNSEQVRVGDSDLTLSGSAKAYFVDGSKIERIQVSEIVSDTNDMAYYVTDEGEISHLFIVNAIAEEYTVTFDANGGEQMSPLTVTSGETLTDVPTPVREGHMFKGWTLNGQPYDFTAPVTSDITLTAQWETVNVYTITFDANGGMGAMNPVTVQGYEYTLPQCGFTPPSGAKFSGVWSVYTANSSEEYREEHHPGETVTLVGDTTVTAVWEYVNAYTVTFEANGGGGSMSAETVSDNAYTLPQCGFTPPSRMIFKAWSVNGTEIPPGETISVSENITVTAVWLNPYRVLDRLQDMDGYTDQTWHLAGPLSEFRTLKIDDTALTQPDDYAASEGSTKLDIPGGTFARFGEGTHSIEASFQTSPDSSDPGDDGQRVTADYYTVKPTGKVTINADEITGADGVEAAKAVRDVSYTGRFHTTPRLNDDYFRMVVTDGAIPAGMYFHDGGYFTGTPLVAGQSYTFTVGLQIRKNVTDAWPATYEDTVQVTITVEQDTAQNVETSSDLGYELVERIPTTIEVDTTGEWVHLTSKGPFEEFADFYIDGVKQTRDVDYTVRACLIDPVTGQVIHPLDGGAITGTFIQLQKSKLNLGTHSLNLEFVKTDPIGNKQVQNASQKVTVTQKSTPVVTPTSGGSSGGGSSGGGSGSGGGSSSKTSYYSVKVGSVSHGTISVSAKSAAYGQTVTVTATPDSGYQVKSVSAVDSKKSAVKLTQSGNKYTFSMPKRAVTVSATFEKLVYGVSAAAAQHGKITLNSSSASPGATVNGSTTPDKGYLLSGVTVLDASGKSVKVETFNDGKFTFLMPSGKATVSATFAVKRLAKFVDIQGPDWFFDDAEWAYDKNILRGTTEQYWEPQSLMSSVTSIVTLERLDGVDLTPYDTGADDGIDNSKWYASAQRWARDNNILLQDRPFGERDAMTRGECAVMITNYLRYRGLNVTSTSEAAFTDVAQMTPDELNAFRLLQDADVFRGYSDGSIRPNAYLSRAHLSALLHRLSAYIIKAETEGV